MNKNDSPLFALAPPEVLAKAQALAEEFRRDFLVKDWIGRHILLTTLVGMAVLAGSVFNAYAFWSNLGPMMGGLGVWANRIFGLCVIAIGLGGSACAFNAYVSWVEFIALKTGDADGTTSARPGWQARPDLPIVSRSAWLPLLPLMVAPALVNAFFSLRFFLALLALCGIGLTGWLVRSRIRAN